MKTAELREQTVEELQSRERELAEQLFALRLQKVTGQVENPAKIRAARRNLARVLTILRQKAGATAGRPADRK
jgi:large subunit ribosomal protein L29